MTTTTTTTTTLTPEQLVDIAGQIRQDYAGGLVALFRILEPAWDELERVDPRRYEIPKHQWLELAQAATDAGQGLSFMNIGPSSREDAR